MKTIFKLLFWCGLVVLGMYFAVGYINPVTVGLFGGWLIMFAICLVLMTSSGARTIQHNTNKFVIDNIRKRNEQDIKKHTKTLNKINEGNKRK